MPEDNATIQGEKPAASATLPRVGVIYWRRRGRLSAGRAADWPAAFAPAGEQSVTLDEAQLRAIIASVLEEYNLSKPQLKPPRTASPWWMTTLPRRRRRAHRDRRFSDFFVHFANVISTKLSSRFSRITVNTSVMSIVISPA